MDLSSIIMNSPNDASNFRDENNLIQPFVEQDMLFKLEPNETYTYHDLSG